MQSNWHSDWLITNMVGLQTDFLIGLIAIMLLANFPWLEMELLCNSVKHTTCYSILYCISRVACAVA